MSITYEKTLAGPRVAMQLDVVTCCRCGVVFAVPSHVIEARRKSGRAVRCPNGCKNYWQEQGMSRDELAEENADLRRDIVRVTHELEQAEARASEACRHAAEDRDDAPSERATGVHTCPHCKRQYATAGWLRRHMREQHDRQHADAE